MSTVRGPLLSETPQTPILIGGVYNASAPAPQDGQGCALQLDSEGNLLVNVIVGSGGSSRALVGSAVLSNNSVVSGASLIGAGATGVYNDISTFIATNRSSTATVVTLTDGTASYTFALAANGGIVINFPTPLPATTAATAWTVGNSATVACDYVVVYAKNK